MATLNFPDTTGQPTDGSFTYEENGVIYVWDGAKWTAGVANNLTDTFVNRDGDTMTGDLTVPSLNGGPLSGLRNQIINGDFRVWQRGTSFPVATPQAPASYTADRWYSGNGGIDRTESSLTGSRTFRATNTGAAATSLRQGIELPGPGLAGPFTRNSEWTLSWYAGDDSVEVTVGFGNEVINVPGTTILSSATGTQIGTSNRRSITFTIPDADPAGTDTLFFVMLVIQGGASIAHIQLEPGPVATPFEQRPIGLELQLCQRYFVNGLGTTPQIYQIDGGTDYFRTFQIFLPVPMRVAPTATATTNTLNYTLSSDVNTIFGSLGGLSATDSSTNSWNCRQRRTLSN